MTGRPILCALALAVSGCSTDVRHANGSAWIKSYSNIARLEAHSGNESVVIEGLDNSTPARANWLGLQQTFATVGTTLLGLNTGGGNAAAPMLVKAASIIAPHVSQPRAAPDVPALLNR